MSLNFDNKKIINNMYKGSFGLEKESLRVTNNGCLSHTAHPFAGSKHFDIDFCLNQPQSYITRLGSNPLVKIQ